MRPRPAVLLAALVPLACQTAPRTPHWYLHEKGPYQALYAPDGRLQRVLYDGDGDQRAEVVNFYDQEGRLTRSEVDSDRDGTVDRWEEYGPDGRLARVGRASGGGLRPDVWAVGDGSAGGATRAPAE